MTQKRNWVLGLTGGIGTGKSTVSNFFRKYGCTVINADTVSRKVVEPGKPALLEIIEKFGINVTLESKGEVLNRSKLRELVFGNQERIQTLNAIMYPHIMAEIDKELSEAEGVYTVLEAPLLFEYHLDVKADRILCMISDTETQILRTMERDGCSRETARNIILRQMPQDEKIHKSDDILKSDMPTPLEVEPKIKKLHEGYLEYARKFNTQN